MTAQLRARQTEETAGFPGEACAQAPLWTVRVDIDRYSKKSWRVIPASLRPASLLRVGAAASLSHLFLSNIQF